MTELLNLTDEVLQDLISKPQFYGEFPFMRSASVAASQGGKPCPPCQRKKQSADLSAHLNTVKAALANMSPAKQARFRQVAGTKRVRLYYRNYEGQLVKTTF